MSNLQLLLFFSPILLAVPVKKGANSPFHTPNTIRAAAPIHLTAACCFCIKPERHVIPSADIATPVYNTAADKNGQKVRGTVRLVGKAGRAAKRVAWRLPSSVP
jgi:hypothetical protein